LRIDAHHSFSERYPLAHLESILRRNRFEGSVLVGPGCWPHPGFVKAVVVRADAFDGRLLDECQHHAGFRGMCCRAGFEPPEGVAELERRGLTLDLLGGLGRVPYIAEQHPGLRIAIDHLGMPPPEGWAEYMERAAACGRVFCKLSGLAGMIAAPRPYVQQALSLFGPDRLMFGSDWPNALPEHSWKASLAAFTQAIGPQTIEVREKLLGGTAARFYAI